MHNSNVPAVFVDCQKWRQSNESNKVQLDCPRLSLHLNLFCLSSIHSIIYRFNPSSPTLSERMRPTHKPVVQIFHRLHEIWNEFMLTPAAAECPSSKKQQIVVCENYALLQQCVSADDVLLLPPWQTISKYAFAICILQMPTKSILCLLFSLVDLGVCR